MGILVFTLILATTFQAQGQSIPVYLKPNHPAATGHYELETLKKRELGYDQFEWLWVRTDGGINGWLLKSSALLPLDFSRQAMLPKGEPIHPQPKNYILPQRSLEQSQVVTLVSRLRDWYKIIYLEKGKKFYGWVRSRYLSPYSKDAGYLFPTKEVYLRKQPKIKSKLLKLIKAGDPVVPLNTKGQWALVRSGKIKGYIPLQNIKSRIDVALKVRTSDGYFKPHKQLLQKKVVEIFTNPLWVGTGAFSLDLKAQPNMSSTTLKIIKPWQNLTLQGYSIKKWGKSHIPRLGEVWWPESTIESNVEIIKPMKPQLTKLKSSEIYQVEKSPVVPGLKFASASSGVYRSFDGKNWYPLKDFKNGFPIKVTNNGVLFVADQVSFDHGESFQHFIRWDLVFNSLAAKKSLKGPVQILNVEANPKNFKQVTLSLKVGSKAHMQLYTPNLGKNWRLK